MADVKKSKICTFAKDPTPCCCNNLCNRGKMTARGTAARKGCPCFARGSYCFDACCCGTKQQICKNRPTNGRIDTSSDEDEKHYTDSSDFEFDEEVSFILYFDILTISSCNI